MPAGDSFRNLTRRIHEFWKIGFIYLRVVGWSWYYLSTVLDDFSRYIIAWKLFTSMTTLDMKEILNEAVRSTQVNHI
jgi:putative transposase